jgi:uncharacterized protein (DUF2164 family)
MRRKEPVLTLPKEHKKIAAQRIRNYIDEILETETGNLRAEMLVDFITENIGFYYYNQAVADAMKAMEEKIEDLYLLMKDVVD